MADIIPTFKKRTAIASRKRAASISSASSSSSDEALPLKKRRTAGVSVSTPSHPTPTSTTDTFTAARTGISTSNDATRLARSIDAPTPHNDGKTKVGPQKSANVRTITTFDFAPDVCKDYKQTGFCGFGDSCKFLHAREDYKQGWELERDWEVGAKKIAVVDEEEDELEGVPFVCWICREDYKDPVVTKCGHYFCEKCALKRFRKTPNCAVCGVGTGGVFNAAKGLKKLLERKTERAKKRLEEEEEQEKATI